MYTKQKLVRVLLFALMIALLIACAPTISQPTSTETSTAAATITSALQPIFTSTPNPTATATDVAIATPDFSTFAKISHALELDPAKLESLPNIPFDVLTTPDGKVSPAFNAWLDQMDAAGKLKDFPNKELIISTSADSNYGFGPNRFQKPPESEIDAYKSGIVKVIFYISDKDLTEGTFNDPSRIPAVTECVL